MTATVDQQTIQSCLSEWPGGKQAELAEVLAQRCTAITLPSGAALFKQGDDANSMYLVLRGRLIASVSSAGSKPKVVMEVGANEVIGEIALFTDHPRTATISASRDSLLLEISREQFDHVSSIAPEFALHISRQVIDRLSRSMLGLSPPSSRAHILVLAATHLGIDERAIALKLSAALQRHGPTLVIDEQAAKQHCGAQDALDLQAFAAWLEDEERKHPYILLLAGEPASQWSQTCVGLADRVLILADADSPASDDPQFNDAVERAHANAELLVLNRGRIIAQRSNARTLLAGRAVNHHHNICIDDDQDYARLARFYANKAIGLVLAGGGAKGFAHIGALRAMREFGIPVDSVGGTSIGSIVGALIAMQLDIESMHEMVREGFVDNKPLSDYTLPSIALLRGSKLNRLLQQYINVEFIENLWLNFYCVSANLTNNQTQVHKDGVLWHAIRASASLPGMLPPVVQQGQLLVDGGLVNNLPVDIMAESSVGKIIAIDLQGGGQQFSISDEHVTASQTLKPRRRWRFGKKRESAGSEPGMFEIMMRASLISSAQQTTKNIAGADLFLNPPMENIGLLDFAAYQSILDAGYRHAVDVFEKTDLSEFSV